MSRLRDDFRRAIEDDINVPLALGILFTAIKEPKSKDIYELALEFDKIFGLSFDKIKAAEAVKEEAVEIPDEIASLVKARAEAKASKNYALADEIRAEIAKKGYNVLDTRDGVKVTPVK